MFVDGGSRANLLLLARPQLEILDCRQMICICRCNRAVNNARLSFFRLYHLSFCPSNTFPSHKHPSSLFKTQVCVRSEDFILFRTVKLMQIKA